MDNDELRRQIHNLEEEIAHLPKGNVSYKKINGKEQPYLQWTENGKRRSKYIKVQGREEMLSSIERRNQLQAELDILQQKLPVEAENKAPKVAEMLSKYMAFETRIITGRRLKELCEPVRNFHHRDCYRILDMYLKKGTPGRVCLLYGLRRTGKTTMLLQAISQLPADQTAYIKIMGTDSFDALERDMSRLAELGYKYLFIDEVTLLKDFVDSASLFSDIYAMMGMKIVLSGTDSLGFLLSAGEELYDRAYTIHTTFIPFREYSRLLGIHDIDEYIRYGGTFRAGETDFEDQELLDAAASFRDDESTRRYIDTAIAHNIQHSLAHYRQGTHFRHLVDLYEAGELTSAVNRIIEDLNHSFLLSVLTRDFFSNDLGISRKNLRKNPNPAKRSDALTKIDADRVTERLKEILDIRNKEEMKVQLTADHITEIKEYLYLLDLIVDCPTETIQGETPSEHILFTQPGMRYSQAQALVYALMKDKAFAELDAAERTMVTERILEEVRGRMMEEIILLETAKALDRNQHVFKLQFPIGEFDMTIYDSAANTCSIYEVKHSKEVVPAQYRFLADKKMCEQTAHRFGPITGKYVLYRGADCEESGISYRNVEGYLESLGK